MITGVILARNEEGNIVDCLRALKPHVDEVLLIDMESTDRTIELAEPLVTRILSHPLVANFDAARNIAIPEAAFDWLWFVDADERIPDPTGRLARQIVAKQGHEIEAVHIPFKSYFCGKWIEHCGWWPGYTMPRLLKRGYFRFAERLHGGVEFNGRSVRVAPTPALGIDHFSYRSISHYLDKVNNYTTTEARQLADNGVVWNWEDATRSMVQDLWAYYERNDGHRDGEHGWILSWLSGQYRWLSHAKLLDIGESNQESGRRPSIPDSLDSVIDVMQAHIAHLRTRQPQLPLGVVFRSPIWDPSGYAEEGRAIAKALADGSRDLSVSDIPWSDTKCDLNRDRAALLRSLLRARRPKFTAAITNCIPTLVEPDPLAALNIVRVASETDRIPTGWQEQLAKFDEVWVLSRHSAVTLRQSGVIPERIRVVPSCLDTDIYRPEGDKLTMPQAFDKRFIFLSVFDWQQRKGWDVLLKAYCKLFRPADGSGLLVKISRSHGHSLETVHAQMDQLLSTMGQSRTERPDIVLWDRHLSDLEMAALYRSVDAFVLPSRGEGWGRPYMEAMASGLPTIGTGASGNVDFMNTGNSFLIPATLVDVPQVAAAEIPVFAGHKWFEPDENKLVEAMRLVRKQPKLRAKIARQAAKDIVQNYGLSRMCERIEDALSTAESRFVVPLLPTGQADQIPVELEGEFFAQHSFSIVNEKLLTEFLKDDNLEISARRVFHNPTFDEQELNANRIRAAVGRELSQGPAVTIRHSFPPNWSPLATGLWVHIQPWEFGYLPEEWLHPLQERVDEIWAPSRYVRDVYVRSGVSPDKLQVIPWGIDATVFNPEAPPLFMRTRKSFLFLFVGGTIQRKGIDLALNAYLNAFRPDDDVCLVIKDMGTKSFYRDSNFSQQIVAASKDKRNPEILHIDSQLSECQMASLYTACQCLVAPYRGEGFGLPILEAMACGLMPIVPREGPTDDFTTPSDALYLDTRVVESQHPWRLCGPPIELQVDVVDLRDKMRSAYEDRELTCSKGAAGSQRVREQFTWISTVRLMSERIRSLAGRLPAEKRITAPRVDGDRSSWQSRPAAESTISACVMVANDESTIAECLARINPFTVDVLVVAGGSVDRSLAIAREYSAQTFEDSVYGSLKQARQTAVRAAKGHWLLFIAATELLMEADLEKLRRSLEVAPPNAVGMRCRIVSGLPDQVTSHQVRLMRNDPTLLSNFDFNDRAEPPGDILDTDVEIIGVKAHLSL